jgi:hypothetical protein
MDKVQKYNSFNIHIELHENRLINGFDVWSSERKGERSKREFSNEVPEKKRRSYGTMNATNSTLRMEAARSSETLVSYRNTALRSGATPSGREIQMHAVPPPRTVEIYLLNIARTTRHVVVRKDVFVYCKPQFFL